jgi:single-stranded-DNA-specific exonuclease
MVLSVPASTGVSGRRWQLRGRFPDGELAGAPYQPLIRHLLWHRGFRDAGDAAAFIEARDPGHDPRLLPDVEAAVGRLRKAIDGGELIAVYGDFDVDGVTATAILIEAIADLGGRAVPYIPDRFGEGYGVNSAAIESLAGQGVSLIVTADCGTSSVAEIELARTFNVDTIIVDHHTVPPVLPPAVAIVNPKQINSKYPENELSSGGLALRVMQLLYEAEGRALDAAKYLDLVALSTVCDMAPLRGENRWLVREGLRALAKAERPGLRALFEASGCDPAHVTADTIGYVLGPRLNAAGRLAHARHSLDLLLERDELKARALALQLCDLNTQRQKATSAAMELAKGLVAELPPGQPLIFVGHESIPSGIVGLVAGRLMEEHHRPAVVYERGAETSRASCRSIPEFDITDALRNVASLMVRFGGHRAAAGFTVENANLGPLRESLVRQAREALAGVDLTPVIDVDAAIPLGRVNGDLVRSLSAMAPFGIANPEPVFLSRGLEVRDVRVMGEDGKHLRLQLRDGRVTWPAVAFGFGERELAEGDRLDVVYTFSADRGGDGALELRVADFAPSSDVS